MIESSFDLQLRIEQTELRFQRINLSALNGSEISPKRIYTMRSTTSNLASRRKKK